MDAQKIFELHLPNKSSLYSHYMPFLEGGGLFIPTAETYCPGDKVFLTLGFLAEPDRYPVAAIVVWLTPSCAQNQRKQGIGVQFLGQNNRVREKMESLLAGDVDIESRTLTF